MYAKLIPLSALIGLLAYPATAQTIVRQKVVKAQQGITKYLDGLGAPHGWIRHLPQDRLARAFPGYHFFQVRYARGAAKRLPVGLAEGNLFLVDPEGKVLLLNKVNELATVFQSRFAGVTSEKAAGDVARALAVLAVARYPGFVFGEPKLKTRSEAAGGITVIANSEATAGGTGSVESEVRFGPKGRLTALFVHSKLSRPAQFVRTAAVVKRATALAREELVRLKLPADTLKEVTIKEVDAVFPGAVYFSLVGARQGGGWGGTARQFVVVEPDRQVVVLESIRDLGRYVRAAYDPITSDEQARLAMGLFLRLLRLRYPEVTFKEAETIRVQADGDGRLVSGRLDAEAGARGHIDVRWRFGKNGRLTEGKVNMRPPGK